MGRQSEARVAVADRRTSNAARLFSGDIKIVDASTFSLVRRMEIVRKGGHAAKRIRIEKKYGLIL